MCYLQQILCFSTKPKPSRVVLRNEENVLLLAGISYNIPFFKVFFSLKYILCKMNIG